MMALIDRKHKDVNVELKTKRSIYFNYIRYEKLHKENIEIKK